MNHHQSQQFNRNKQNFHENSTFKSSYYHRNIPKTAPQKSRNEANISANEFDISEEDFFGSMLSLDVQPICKPKRISKTPIVGKRKRKIYDQEITPIPKIDTQKLHSSQESKRASTTTSVIRPSRNGTSLSTSGSHMFIPNFSQTQKQLKIQMPDSQTPSMIDPLTITQIDTIQLQRKPSKGSQISLSYGSIVSTRKILSKSHSGCVNRSKSPKKKINASINIVNNIDNDKKTNENDNEIHFTNEKLTTCSDTKIMPKDESKSKLSVKFDKKAFLKKLDNIDQDIHVKSTIAFTNGRVLPSLHFQKEPDRYVIACAIHIEFTFNFFTFATNPIIEKNLLIDEESYDLFDSNSENSNRLCRSSKYFQLQKEIHNSSCFKDPLDAFMNTTPSLTRMDIEEHHFIEQTKLLKSNLDSNEVQKKYPNNTSTDSTIPFIPMRFDCSKMPNDVLICDESSDDDNCIDFSWKNCSLNLSSLKSLSELL